MKVTKCVMWCAFIFCGCIGLRLLWFCELFGIAWILVVGGVGVLFFLCLFLLVFFFSVIRILRIQMSFGGMSQIAASLLLRAALMVSVPFCQAPRGLW